MISSRAGILVHVVAVVATLLLGPTQTARASGMESCGPGSRGRAMGYAMVAVADDWTAIQYNPAGGFVPGAKYESSLHEFYVGIDWLF
jgi:hypothetical protein